MVAQVFCEWNEAFAIERRSGGVDRAVNGGCSGQRLPAPFVDSKTTVGSFVMKGYTIQKTLLLVL